MQRRTWPVPTQPRVPHHPLFAAVAARLTEYVLGRATQAQQVARRLEQDVAAAAAVAAGCSRVYACGARAAATGLAGGVPTSKAPHSFQGRVRSIAAQSSSWRYQSLHIFL